MIVFQHTIADPLGIHARPAAMLVKEASVFRSSVCIRFGDKEISAKRMIALMGLGLKHSDRVEICIEGEDEQQAAESIQVFLTKHL